LVYYTCYKRTMSNENGTKINQLLNSHPKGTVMLTKWLVEQGYSSDLLQRYKKGKWLESIGRGAMIRFGDNITYEGAVYSLQDQAGSSIHPGGRTALTLLGNAQYLNLSEAQIWLFGGKKEVLPSWFKDHDRFAKMNFRRSSFLPNHLGMTDIDLGTFSLRISGSARAMMECLYLVPKEQEMVECYELMEGLNNLRPDLVQELLGKCRSIKVKRLFLYLAEKAGHRWLEHIDMKKIDLGKGKRSLAQSGIYVPKYRITVPKELENNDASEL